MNATLVSTFGFPLCAALAFLMWKAPGDYRRMFPSFMGLLLGMGVFGAGWISAMAMKVPRLPPLPFAAAIGWVLLTAYVVLLHRLAVVLERDRPKPDQHREP